MSVSGRNYETDGPSNNGRSALCRRVSSIRFFAAICVRLAPRSEIKLNPQICVGKRGAFTGNTVSINDRCRILRSLQSYFQLVNIDINGRSLRNVRLDSPPPQYETFCREFRQSCPCHHNLSCRTNLPKSPHSKHETRGPRVNATGLVAILLL
jgi:hypothetical protein